MAEEKRYSVALCLLLCGGLFGLHHIYLGRKRHAVVYLFTMGGFVLGLFRDLTQLGRYVRWANFERHKEEFVAKIREDPDPSISLCRGFAMALVSQMFGCLVHLAIPTDLLPEHAVSALTVLLVPPSVAFAVHYIGSIGELTGSLRDTMKGALFTAPLYVINQNPEIYTSLVAAYFFRGSCKYRLKPEPSGSLWSRLAYVSAYFCIITLLFTSMFCFNCQMESDGEVVKCRDALKHFFKSPLWRDIIASLTHLKEAVQRDGGVSNLFKTLVGLLDPTGELEAARILGVSRIAATEEDIRKAYRSLSKEFHPDRNKNRSPEEMEEAAQRFMEVQDAFNILSERQKNKIAANQEHRENR